MKYNIFDPENMEKAFKFYYNNYVSHKETYEKFNIKPATYFSHLRVYKSRENMQKGGICKNIETLNNIILQKEKTQKGGKIQNCKNIETINNIFFKKETDKEQKSNAMEMMNNIGKRKERSKHIELSDVVVEEHKKNTDLKQQLKKKIVSPDEPHNIVLNEKDKILKKTNDKKQNIINDNGVYRLIPSSPHVPINM